MKNMAAVNLGLNWLVNSGIRHTNGNLLALGGVNQGYNWQEQSYPYIYSEITGYAISTFVNAYRWTTDESYLDRALQSADFLLRVQRLAEEDGVAGAIPHGLSLPDLQPLRQYHSFDAAMCLQGLLDLDAVRPTAKLRTAAQDIGDWLLEQMQQPGGAFLSMVDVETGERYHVSGNFFDDYGCLHAKHTIGLLKLAAVMGDDRYAVAAQKVCDWVLELQEKDGGFRATQELQHVVSHPHCYVVEGLLYAYKELGTDRYLAAARRAGQWLLDMQNKDGSINIEYKKPWWRMGRRITEKFLPRRVSDATAQAMRIWLILYYLDQDQRFLDASRKGARFLFNMQCTTSPDQNALGGFYYWPGRPVMFTWCTMFAVNALYALEHIDRVDGYQQMMVELF